MGQTIQQDSLISQLQAIYRRINVLEYQQKKTFGNIVIDGNLGFLSVFNGGVVINGSNGQVIATNGTTTMTMDSVAGKFTASTNTGSIEIDGNNGNMIGSTTLDARANMYTMKKSGVNVAKIDYRSRLIGAARENAVETYVFQGTENDRLAYNTLSVFNNAGVREAAFEMNVAHSGGVFTSASVNFGLQGVLSSFALVIDGAVGGTGYMNLITRASDPAAFAGRMYYNTTLGKFRIYDGAGWRSL